MYYTVLDLRLMEDLKDDLLDRTEPSVGGKIQLTQQTFLKNCIHSQCSVAVSEIDRCMLLYVHRKHKVNCLLTCAGYS